MPFLQEVSQKLCSWHTSEKKSSLGKCGACFPEENLVCLRFGTESRRSGEVIEPSTSQTHWDRLWGPTWLTRTCWRILTQILETLCSRSCQQIPATEKFGLFSSCLFWDVRASGEDREPPRSEDPEPSVPPQQSFQGLSVAGGLGWGRIQVPYGNLGRLGKEYLPQILLWYGWGQKKAGFRSTLLPQTFNGRLRV